MIYTRRKKITIFLRVRCHRRWSAFVIAASTHALPTRRNINRNIRAIKNDDNFRKDEERVEEVAAAAVAGERGTKFI